MRLAGRYFASRAASDGDGGLQAAAAGCKRWRLAAWGGRARRLGLGLRGVALAGVDAGAGRGDGRWPQGRDETMAAGAGCGMLARMRGDGVRVSGCRVACGCGAPCWMACGCGTTGWGCRVTGWRPCWPGASAPSMVGHGARRALARAGARERGTIARRRGGARVAAVSGYRGHGWRRGGALDELDVGDGRVRARAAHGVHGHGRRVSRVTVPVSSGRGVMLGRGSARHGRERGALCRAPRRCHATATVPTTATCARPGLSPCFLLLLRSNSSMQGVRKEVRELG